ncbi:endonuclease/exonuclease/phosphatase family protein [Euzebya tangerina]|uniref:endonuclease/exonuclease/phosphatase family protein n=1 Tax=Euzebya tangerina TaxID=591198 RepID=UPI000E321083|nr:endonuclease/exonuclease/phosphatase family protein [Euzebya tangerina]
MRIVSLNAWCGTLFEPLAAWLPTCGADVLCVQEVTRSPGLDGWVAYDDGEHAQSQRADLFGDIRGLLPDHQASFVAHDAGPVDRDGIIHRQDFGLALFIADRLPVVGQATAPITGAFTDHRDTWPASHRPRLAQTVRVIDRDAHRGVLIAHLHGVRDAEGKGDTAARRAQAKALRDLIVWAQEPDDLIVVVGDFNLLPDSETFDVLAEIGLTDLVGTADTRTSHYPKQVRHANYLLVSDTAAVAAFQVLDHPEVSDHRALILDI